MSLSLSESLDLLRSDFQKKTGDSFSHFYCPILHRDEDVELCRGHVLNQAFHNTDRSWCVQRSDVDNFFGSMFEADFVLLQERSQHDLTQVFFDKTLSRKLRPNLTIDDRVVEHYIPTASIPDTHTELLIDRGGNAAGRLALKLTPSEAQAARAASWKIGFERDLRLASLVSLLKAAHLTMFALLGYEWALSAAGHFVGHDILGNFFLRHHGQSKARVLAAGDVYFREFINLVRPVVAAPSDIESTIGSSLLYMCTEGLDPWAFLLFVRTGRDLHSVLLPSFNREANAARFLRFLKDPAEKFEAKLAEFQGDRWAVSPTSSSFRWPAANWL